MSSSTNLGSVVIMRGPGGYKKRSWLVLKTVCDPLLNVSTQYSFALKQPSGLNSILSSVGFVGNFVGRCDRVGNSGREKTRRLGQVPIQRNCLRWSASGARRVQQERSHQLWLCLQARAPTSNPLRPVAGGKSSRFTRASRPLCQAFRCDGSWLTTMITTMLR